MESQTENEMENCSGEIKAIRADRFDWVNNPDGPPPVPNKEMADAILEDSELKWKVWADDGSFIGEAKCFDQ